MDVSEHTENFVLKREKKRENRAAAGQDPAC